MTPLQIGQSLTPEQVRSLPDGSKVLLDWGIMYKDVFTAPIQNTMTGENGRIAVMLLSIAGWHSATLVSLPTAEPSPGEGYRWVKYGEEIQIGDEVLNDGAFIPCVKNYRERCLVHGFRRRIEPQADPDADKVLCRFCHKPTIDNIHALCGPYSGIDYAQEPTPRASSEIERRAAWALLHAEIVELHRAAAPNGIEYDCLRIVGVCRKVIEAESYARSIGAIE